ncbi:MAG: peptide chain release factor 1 [Solobacterium sp.]|nr:peptide chain release factor 1 [Solobacterium sp.]
MNVEAMYAKLHALEQEYQEISDKLMSEEVLKDPREVTRLSRAQARMTSLVEASGELKDLDQRIQEAHELEHDNDPELSAMALEELTECEPKREELLEKIRHLLIPTDPDDDHNVIMEIRGGAGGDEGNIFAGDLYRMYVRYAESKGWKIDVMEASESEAGGFSQIIFEVKGHDVYKALKFESGAHRVQRVPKTESQGRIQTSTATVLAQPEAEDADIEIDPKDLTIETHRASGAGGQHINKTDSAVRIVHVPTGITVNCQEGRSQIENRETAMRLIKSRVYEEYKRQKEEAEGKIRRQKIGTGDRSEKIRTYNYPQNRVTDHRIGFTITQLDRVMEGKLQDVIDALQADDEKKKLESAE